ncbi:MAG: M28 family peptidase [Gammaproteobacteria bacterium]|nr:M28 family peptidase [Pseudomonadales bacterium]MCP5348509.1 M28 family peptidase [Pseudomonadales bacterium]
MRFSVFCFPCRRLPALISLLILPLLATTGFAQTAWFGLELPGGFGNPHAPTVDLSDVQPIPVSVPAAERQSHADLEGQRILPLVEQIVGFSHQSHRDGNRVWGRVTGFPSQRATVEWVAEQFREAGLQQVAVQEYPGEGEFWWPSDWQVTLLGDAAYGTGSSDVILESSLVTAGSEIPGGSLTATLVDTGHILDPVPDVDLHGRIAVQTLTPPTGAYSERTPTQERARALMARGAVAVINVVEQLGNMHTRDFSNCNGPCYNLGTADGEFLKAAIREAADRGLADRLQLRLSLQAGNLTGLKGYNAIGIVPGEGPEIVIVNAHADGWYDAAGDNADGLAVLIAMARHFAGQENRPERTLLFVASGGHHSPGLNGPRALVAMNPDLVGRAVLVFNLEHIAQFAIDSSDWSVGPGEQRMSYSVTNMAPFLVSRSRDAMARYGFNLNPEFREAAPGDLGGYRSLGIPMIQAIHSGPLYHASGDVLATISEPGLERAARFFTYLVEQVVAADRRQLDPE